MPSITIWDRIEPRCRANDLSAGLAARVHDPLWLLARQWQVSEFAGADAGSPITASVQSSIAPLDRYQGAAQPQQAYNPQRPLESLVECESVRPASAAQDFRQAAEAGLYFVRLLAAANLPPSIAAAYLDHYRLAQLPGALTGTIAAVAGGRAIDGVALNHDLLAAGSTLPAQPVIPGAQQAVVLSVTRSYLSWYAEMFDEPVHGENWTPERMEYSFAIGASGDDGSYTAQEYDGGATDWYTFDRSTAPLSGTPPQESPPSSVTRQFTVSPVTFRGIPSRRFWEFEDAAVNIGALSAAAEDLGRLLLRNFALIYSNDWFQFPFVVPVGSQVLIDSLSVADTFGLATSIPSYTTVDGALRGWKMFQVGPDPANPPSLGNAAFPPQPLLIVPGAVSPNDSATIEDVLVLRDEQANMAWGIERTVLDASGQPLDRTLAWRTSAPSPSPPSGDAVQKYHLGSTVPDYWLPFLPVVLTPNGPQLLRRGKLPTSVTGPLGRMLAYPRLTLFSEEVPREGVHLERRYRIARGPDGSTYLWIGRARSTGSGEGKSGLRFDYLE